MPASDEPSLAAAGWPGPAVGGRRLRRRPVEVAQTAGASHHGRRWNFLDGAHR